MIIYNFNYSVTMTFVNLHSTRKLEMEIIGNTQEHMEGNRTRQISALVTQYYVREGVDKFLVVGMVDAFRILTPDKGELHLVEVQK